MTCEEMLAQVLDLLQRQGWASYRTLRRRWHLDEATLATLRDALLETRQVTVDEAGTRLVWTGELRPASVTTWAHTAAPPSSLPTSQSAARAIPLAGGEAQRNRAGDSRRRLPPLVGRELEVRLLQERWAQVQAGTGQVVMLSGEAGIGKSHLVQVVKAYVAGAPHFRWEYRCAATYQNSALYPLIELFQRAFQYQPDDSPAAKLRKLETTLALYDVALPEVVPLLAALLSVPLGDHYPPLTDSPQRQKQRTLEAVWTLVQALAAPQPVVLIVEDLHWVDPSTLALLSLLVARAPMARLYVLLTCRPEFHPPWAPLAHLTSLTLTRLLPGQVKLLAERIAGGKTLPPAVLQQIVEKTEGVPLFVEELTKMVLEAGLLREGEAGYELTGPLPPLALPTTLQDSLRARLEGLGEAQEVAQVGAVWGRGFTEAQLQAVLLLDRRRLERALERLVAADLLQEVSLPPRVTYIFKHALIQEAAYASLPQARRQQVHEQIAQVLTERFPETVETQPELLAHHYTEAGLNAQAIAYWQRAGERAAQRSAYMEATSHLTKGLEWLKTLPDTPARAPQELALQTTLGLALMVTRGYAAEEVGAAYSRARELCQQVGETLQLFPVLWGLWAFYAVRAEHQTARELGEQLLTLAQRVQDPLLFVVAHYTLGFTWFCLGETTRARTHLGKSVALYDPQQHRSYAFLYGGQDPGVACRSYTAWALWLLGYPDQALERLHAALALAHQLSHPFSLVYALAYAARLQQLHREGPATQAQAEAAIAVAAAQGFAQWLAQATILRGWALVEQGQEAEGMAQLRQGLAAYWTTGAKVLWPYFLALLAEAHGKGGQTEEGLRVLAEALAVVHNTGERFYEAELHRLTGELLLQSSVQGPQSDVSTPPSTGHMSHAEAAEACFQQALDVARRQQAKSLELRAAMSLSRLWRQQGKRDAAHQLLAEIYGWFTEGFDTADLKEARALLDKLG